MAIYKFMGKVNKKTAPKKAAVFVEKQVGGAKNGGTRMVRAKKLANDVPTVDAAAPGTSKNFFANHVRKVRASLTAGTRGTWWPPQQSSTSPRSLCPRTSMTSTSPG